MMSFQLPFGSRLFPQRQDGSPGEKVCLSFKPAERNESLGPEVTPFMVVKQVVQLVVKGELLPDVRKVGIDVNSPSAKLSPDVGERPEPGRKGA